MHELWVAHASRVLEMVSHHRGLFLKHCSEGETLHFRKDCFGATPLQRMQSNGQAFQPARDPLALPRNSRTIACGLHLKRFDDSAGA